LLVFEPTAADQLQPFASFWRHNERRRWERPAVLCGGRSGFVVN
jgi:hypothetical protein